MNALFRSLATLLATATDHQLWRDVEFLKAENALLRARLPAEIRTRPAERERPLALGLALGRGDRVADHSCHARRILPTAARGFTRKVAATAAARQK